MAMTATKHVTGAAPPGLAKPATIARLRKAHAAARGELLTAQAAEARTWADLEQALGGGGGASAGGSGGGNGGAAGR